MAFFSWFKSLSGPVSSQAEVPDYTSIQSHEPPITTRPLVERLKVLMAPVQHMIKPYEETLCTLYKPASVADLSSFKSVKCPDEKSKEMLEQILQMDDRRSRRSDRSPHSARPITSAPGPLSRRTASAAGSAPVAQATIVFIAAALPRRAQAGATGSGEPPSSPGGAVRRRAVRRAVSGARTAAGSPWAGRLDRVVPAAHRAGWLAPGR